MCIIRTGRRRSYMEQQTKILIVDDNSEIREVLRILLEGEGYKIFEAGNGAEAVELTEAESFDLIILDIMMPGMDGYHTCMEIRQKSNAPILFLSAKTQEGDKMLGFLSGGDDYLAKPFSYNELVSRAKALIRRYRVYQGKQGGEEIHGNILCFHDLEINEMSGTVTKGDKVIDLTDTEYAVLHLLVKNRHQIFSAERLYETVWEEPYYYGANNTVMVHIRNLRRKIERDPGNPDQNDRAAFCHGLDQHFTVCFSVETSAGCCGTAGTCRVCYLV